MLHVYQIASLTVKYLFPGLSVTHRTILKYKIALLVYSQLMRE